MNLRRGNLAGWEENSGAALAGFQPIMLRGYPRARPPSACVQPPQPHPPQPSKQLPPHLQLLDTLPPLLLPPTATGLILAPRENPVKVCSNLRPCCFDWHISVCSFRSWPSNATNQSDSEGWDAWPTSSSASQNPSLSVPSAQLRQRSAFTPAAMTTGSSPSPVLGQVGPKTASSSVLLLCSPLKKNLKM